MGTLQAPEAPEAPDSQIGNSVSIAIDENDLEREVGL